MFYQTKGEIDLPSPGLGGIGALIAAYSPIARILQPCQSPSFTGEVPRTQRRGTGRICQVYYTVGSLPSFPIWAFTLKRKLYSLS